MKYAHEKYEKFEPKEAILEHNSPTDGVFYKHKDMNNVEASMWNTLHLIPGNLERSMHKATIIFQNIVPKQIPKKVPIGFVNSDQGQYEIQFNELINFFRSRVKSYNKLFNSSMDTCSYEVTRSSSSTNRSDRTKESDGKINNTYSVRR